MLVGLKRISTVLGLLAATASAALAQDVAPNRNQSTADAVAGTLRASRSLAGYRIEIEAREGVVTLTGVLASAAQKAEAVARTRYIAGVRGVVDQLQLSEDRPIQTVQYQPGQAMAYQPGRMVQPGGGNVVYGPGSAPGSTGTAPTNPAYVSDGGPIPEGPAGMSGATQASQPGAPNYAWPSYAPYPNFSAVGYPTAYPWQAWPNIGPFYPYPEVPLDWRAVTLRWDDGIWWLDFRKHYTRPFFTPYPFGLFAY
jgi:BON domain